jgi:hypothetical protein
MICSPQPIRSSSRRFHHHPVMTSQNCRQTQNQRTVPSLQIFLISSHCDNSSNTPLKESLDHIRASFYHSSSYRSIDSNFSPMSPVWVDTMHGWVNYVPTTIQPICELDMMGLPTTASLELVRYLYPSFWFFSYLVSVH